MPSANCNRHFGSCLVLLMVSYGGLPTSSSLGRAQHSWKSSQAKCFVTSASWSAPDLLSQCAVQTMSKWLFGRQFILYMYVCKHQQVCARMYTYLFMIFRFKGEQRRRRHRCRMPSSAHDRLPPGSHRHCLHCVERPKEPKRKTKTKQKLKKLPLSVPLPLI